MLAYKFPMQVEFPGLGIELTLDNVALRLGTFEIYWYAVIIMLGFSLAVLYAFRNNKRFGIESDPMLNVVIIGLISAIIGARTYYVLFRLDFYDSFWDMINIRDGGLAIYGAVIAVFITGIFSCRKNKIPVLRMFDLTAIGFLIGQGIGRWANFINQEAFGSQTDLPWGMISERTLETVSTGPVHPCFLYESLWCAAGFAMLHIISRRYYKFEGQLLLSYILWYGLGRFWIEGLRTDSLWLIENVIRVSQLIAGLCVVAAIPLLVLGFMGKIKLLKPIEQAEAAED